MDYDKKVPETIDEPDLYEELEPEQMYEIIQEERKKSPPKKPKAPKSSKWAFWLIAIFMVLSVMSYLPKTFSIPIFDFLATSAKLSTLDVIDEYQKSVVVVETGESKGTGFSISADGYILTNEHVIDQGSHIWVGYPNGDLFDAKVVKAYKAIDLALLKVEGYDLPFLKLAPETSFEEGEHIYFIGNPLNFNGIANEGEILGYRQSSDLGKNDLMIDAPIYKGNSGSPVINKNGEVIGVIYATTNTDRYGKIGLAIPIDYFLEKQEAILIR